jgi:hypothetical protein
MHLMVGLHLVISKQLLPLQKRRPTRSGTIRVGKILEEMPVMMNWVQVIPVINQKEAEEVRSHTKKKSSM